ncbi:hypothetical protein [Candidatus Enterococcus ikei]|uniref:Uncharacterized protein n=1 Tax=Candidatus Enterococcus ikei TaxID=2815326 RepID=A0ABS3GVT1_9ENTE|nr:hypothetical protein [Enterococcus sp. DIV0869a]MBO0438891.1 hypothetical protein [Enterococcus sp. DIV0869a]
MKKVLLIILFGAFGLSFAQKSEAAEFKELSKEEQKVISENPFGHLGDKDNVVRLPDGEFANGEVIFYESIDSKGVIYDSENDPNNLTVAEAKEIMKNEAKENKTRITRRVIPEYRHVVLKGGASLTVSVDRTYGAIAWYSFPATYSAAAGTGGIYLRYSSSGDSSLAGTASQATSTLLGKGYFGTLIGANRSSYLAGNLTMYTYNTRMPATPSGASYYIHMNIANI